MSQGSPEKQNQQESVYVWMYVCRYVGMYVSMYDEELAHVIMEAEKPHNLPLPVV